MDRPTQFLTSGRVAPGCVRPEQATHLLTNLLQELRLRVGCGNVRWLTFTPNAALSLADLFRAGPRAEGRPGETTPQIQHWNCGGYVSPHKFLAHFSGFLSNSVGQAQFPLVSREMLRQQWLNIAS